MHMKVLFLTPYTLNLRLGGFEAQVIEVYENLKSVGVDVKWYYEVDSFDGFDIMHVWSVDIGMLPYIITAKSKGLKIVLTPMKGSRAEKNWYLRLANSLSLIPQVCVTHKRNIQIISLADYVTPLCKFEAERISSVYNYPASKIKIISNGLSEVFIDNRDAESTLTIPFAHYCLMVGRIEENKNQLTAIQAINELGLNMIIVGKAGPISDNYFERCKASSRNNICYWGTEYNKQKLALLYKKADLTIIPSKSEMVPLVVFESLSQKTPVVCTNRCGITGDLIPGLFFTGIGVSAIKRNIVKALHYDKNAISKKGVFSWRDIAEQYVSVYKTVLSKKNNK